MAGTLALIGGAEWTDGCSFDQALLEASGGETVLVLPTAAAYEHPERAVDRAREWFGALGAQVEAAMVVARPDAMDPAAASRVRAAPFVYLSGGGSPMHFRSVLKDTPVWDGLVEGWREGAVLAASAASARSLCDPMVDPRGGAFTLGLGLLPKLAIIPHHDDWSGERKHRTLELAPQGVPLVGIDERTAVIRGPEESWRVEGVGEVEVFVDHQPAGLEVLP